MSPHRLFQTPTGEDTHNARAIFLMRIAVFILVLVNIASLVLIGVLLSVVLDQSEENGGTADRIRSCTEPTGECAKRNAKQTAALIGRLLDSDQQTRQIVGYAAFCADKEGAQSQAAIETCIRDRLVHADD